MSVRGSYSFIAQRALGSECLCTRSATRAIPRSILSNQRSLYQRGPRKTVTAGKRAFTTTARRKLAAPDESFDPRQQDRESDQVDVCIVGGGSDL